MNEFISQFILESREFVEQAATSLAVLERSYDDAEALDAAFRAFHTLKGGASIVDFTAMEHAVHAAEDVLSRARSGSERLTRGSIESCFACLDQTSRWLDDMERAGGVPPNADAEARTIIERIAGATRGNRATRVPDVAASADWVNAALASAGAASARAQTALRFTPGPTSFFQGIDPLALLASVPQLVWLDAEPADTWPTLEQLDPFESMLSFTALSAATAAEIAPHLHDHASECEIVALPSQASTGALQSDARRLIEAQRALLDATESRTLVGRMTSAGAVAANVLRYCGDVAAAERIRRALDTSLREADPRALQDQLAAILAPERPSADAAAGTSPSTEASIVRTLRVDADRVDALVRLTGEITVVKNAIGHAMKMAGTAEAGSPAEALRQHHGALDHLVGELQRAVRAIRVLPLRAVLQRVPRVVREMSASLHKPVKVIIEGEDTEADKAIVEMLFEPLLHLVRNAIDHGVEAPEGRAERGKPATAILRIRASRQGANVLIEVADDGGGIDPARVRRIAKDRGVAPTESIDAMSDLEVIDLVFVPGFSTATDVTQLSGRGVGMDAVRTAVERVGGRVAIESRAGEGTTVTLTLPFSVMMTHVMTVEAGGQMFGIPLDAVVETIRVPNEVIAGVGAARAIVHRERTLPVFDLANLLRVQEAAYVQSEATLVIASIGGHIGAIRVDRLCERMEVMLKPLDGLLAGLPELTGTTILGDGRVLLVLDLAGVLQ